MSPETGVRWSIDVQGDAIRRRITIDRSASNIESGVTITKAYLTVKASLSDSDANALVQKTITTTDSAGTGQIENDGGGDEDPVVRFDLTASDTDTIGTTWRYYDIQLIASDGEPYTPERGQVRCETEGVTDATS